MIPLFINGWEWVILLAIFVLLFGGAKLAGLGKGAGRAVREFKEETGKMKAEDQAKAVGTGSVSNPIDAEVHAVDESIETAEIVEPRIESDKRTNS